MGKGTPVVGQYILSEKLNLKLETVDTADIASAAVTSAELASNLVLTTPNIGVATGTSLSVTGQLTSTVVTGTAPLAVTSTTRVANLNVATAGNADTVTTNANLTGDITSVGNATAIAAGVIINADINDTAGIVDTKLATISTAGKVSNTATTATALNTVSAIVTRDASGNFSAGTITAALTGSISGNAATVTTNANLTGVVTSIGNATAIADAALSITKTSGLQSALDLKAPLASPTFITPNIGVSVGTSLTTTGGITSNGLTIDNGLADGGDVTFKSAGFNDIYMNNLNGTLRVFDTGELLKVSPSTGNVWVKGEAAINAIARLNAGTVTPWIEMGTQNTIADTPYIDFHSGTSATDYDSRIIASGGTATIGQGRLDIIADTVGFSGVVNGTSFNSITALASTPSPMNGVAAVGAGTTVARADHVHPRDTTKANNADLTMAIGNINSPLLDMPLKNSLAMKSGVGSTTFTRASTATYIDRYGVLKTAAIDEPRFEKEGYLNEGASTNLLLYSEQFDNGVWAKTASTILVNTTATLDPFYGNNSDRLVEDATNSAHLVKQLYTPLTGTVYTYSLFIKAGERTFAFVQILVGGLNSYAIVDLSTGIFTSPIGTGATFTATLISNGWYRLSVVFTTLTNAVGNLVVATATNSTTFSYLGDGTSGLYIFGAQLEAGSKASSYILTVDSTVTRALDVLNVTLMGNTPLGWNDKTIMIDFLYTGGKAEQGLFSFDDINYNMLRVESNSHMLSQYYGAAPANQAALIAGTKYRFAYVISGNSRTANTVRLYANGVLIGSVSSLTPTAINTIASNFVISVGGFNSNAASSPISNFRVWDKALSAMEVSLA